MNEFGQFMLQSSLVAKAVLVILFTLSVFSWGIMIEKFIMFKKASRENDRFSRFFKIHAKWHDRFNYSRELKYSPIAKIFKSHYHDLKPYVEGYLEDNDIASLHHNPTGVNRKRMSLRTLFDVAIAEEMSLMEKRIVFLGTTVSVSPFLGLLGTVWGIMTSFLNMGVKGSAEITAVAPGIAEALITTIAGLAVAIPALVAHNHFIQKLRLIEKELNSFFSYLIITIEQERP